MNEDGGQRGKSPLTRDPALSSQFAHADMRFTDVAKLTGPGSALAKQFADVAKLTGPGSALAKQFADVAKLTGPGSAIAKQFAELAMFTRPTASLTARYGEQLQKLAQASDTIKRYEERLDRLANVATLENIGPLTLAELTPVVGAIDRFSHGIVLEQLFAEQLVVTAANENKLNDVAGASLAVDVAAAERMIEAEGPAGLSLFFDRLAASIRFHFERVQSLAELFHLYNTAMLIAATLAVWYAMDSATSDDVKAVQTAIREEGRASRQQISSKFDELLRGINEHAARKSDMFKPATAYVVKRAIPIKSERRMKSATVGVLQVGQAVFRLHHHKNWIYVEGSDLLTGESVSGWVVKKYLERLR